MPDFANAPKLAEEVELKFTVPAEQVDLLQKRLPLPRTKREHKRARKRRRRLLNVYYDTPDLELRRRGIGLRVRHVDGRRLQTLKCDSPTASPAGRLECEHEIAGDRPDLTCVEEAGLRDFFSNIGAPARLHPVFATDIDRTAWQFSHHGAAIECALDVGEIRAGDKTMPVHELELELKDGTPAGLFDAADALNRQVPLRVEWESKGQRGYALAAGVEREPSPRARLKPKMTTRAALAASAGACLAQIAFHAPPVHRRGGIEDVHQMRVAVRRLRAALSTFRAALGDRRLEFEEDLRWLQDNLGAVRDWDVFRKDTVRPIEGEDRDVALVDEASATCRCEAYGALCGALDSPRCTSFWLSVTRWLSSLADGAARDANLDRPIMKYARLELHRRAKKLAKRGRRIEELDDAALHKLRIGAKKLRYAAEFFRDLFPKKRIKRLFRAMKGLQDLLGNLNDARTARKLLEGLEPKHGGGFALSFARGEGVIEGTVLSRAQTERHQLARQWRQYGATKKPWD